MKNAVLAIVVVLISIRMYAQNSGAGSNFVMPVFIDSARFERDVKANYALKVVYNELQRGNDYVTYKYEFALSPSGKVIAKNFADDTVFKYINEFVRNSFNKYKWKPAHLKGCEKCRKTAYGILYVNLVPVNNVIQLQILMSDGITGRDIYSPMIYDKRISIN